MEVALREFLGFVEELQDLNQRELDNYSDIRAVEAALESMIEGPEKHDVRLGLTRLEYKEHCLELEKAAMRQQCKCMRKNPPF